MRFNGFARLAFAGGGLLFGTAATHAQESAAPSDAAQAGIAEVLVTARNRSERAQDVPIPISVLSAEQLDRDRVLTVADLTQRAPGLTATTPNARRTGVSVRGIGKTSGNDNMEPAVGVIVDDVFLGHVGMTYQDFTDLERVEILRGPQGTLLGKNTSMGAIKYTSRAPSFRPESGLELEGGLSPHSVKGRASHSDGLVEDVLAYRASAFVDKQEGDLENVGPGGGHWHERDRWGGRIQLLLKSSDDLSLKLNFDGAFVDENSNTKPFMVDPASLNDGSLRTTTYTTRLARDYFGGYVPIIGSWDKIELDMAKPLITNNYGASAVVDWKLGGVDLTSISAARWFHFDASKRPGADTLRHRAQRHAGGYAAGFTGVPACWHCHEHGRLPDRYLPVPHRHRHDEPQHLRPGRRRLLRNRRAVSRVEYDRRPRVPARLATRRVLHHQPEAGLGQRRGLRPGVLAGNRSRQDHLRPARNVGVEDERDQSHHHAREWRADRSHGQRDGRCHPRRADWRGFRDGAGREDHDHALAWLVNPSYRVNEDVPALHLRQRGRKIRRRGVRQQRASANVEPEKTLNFEAGIKSYWWNRRATLNANIYYTRVHDYQNVTSEADPTSPTGYSSRLGNIPGLRARGVEFDSQFNFTERLQVTLAGAFNDAIYTDWSTATCPRSYPTSVVVCNNTGKQIVGAPRWTGIFGVDYEVPLASGYSAHFFGNYNYRSKHNLEQLLSEYGEQRGIRLPTLGLA